MADYLALLQSEVVAMADALRTADPARPVPGCPGWTVQDVGAHVTGVHRWARAALDSDEVPAYDERAATDGPLDKAYAASAAALVAALAERPDDAPAWTFDRHDRTAGFWKRRQLHEVAVHRWDVAPYQLTDEVAEDGIDEVLDFFLPRQIAMGRTTVPDGTLRLVAPGRTWQFGAGRPVVSVEGAPSDLLLGLWGRGDVDLGTWGQAGLTP